MSSISLDSIRRELYRKSLYEFLKAFWNTVEGGKLIDSWLIEYLCECFMWAVRDWLPDDIKWEWLSEDEFAKVYQPEYKTIRIPHVQSGKYLNINMPPRHIKSLVFNVFGPTWLFTIRPVKVASVSHTRGLSAEMNRNRQKIIKSQLYQKYFPEIWLTKDQGELMEGNHLGELYSINMSAFTGYGADIIINDDIVSAEHAVKDMMVMANAISYYRNTMPSRINNPNTGIIMNIQQRLAPGDVTGFIMGDKDLASQYTFTVIKAIATDDETLIFPISGRTVFRAKGSALWPERFGNYSQLKMNVGTSVFDTQYQQEPRASDDTYIKDSHVRFLNAYEAEAIMNQPDYIYASHDFPIKDKETSDMLGSVIAYKKGNKLLFTDALETKMAYSRSKTYVVGLANLYPGIIQIVEDKANGAPIIQELQGSVPGIIPYNPGTNSKSQRLESASIYVESGNVFFLTDEMGEPSDAIAMLIDRITKFPFVANDDVVDAFSQCVLYAFLQKMFGVFSSAFTDENLYSPLESLNIQTYKRTQLDYAIVREGVTYKVIRTYYDFALDTFFILNEQVWRSDEREAVEKIREFTQGARMLIDATRENVLFSIFISKLNIMKNTDKRPLMTQLSQIQVGLSMRKIKVNRECSEFRRDLDSISLDKNALKNGQEMLTGNEGLMACLRVIMYTVKGNGDFM